MEKDDRKFVKLGNLEFGKSGIGTQLVWVSCCIFVHLKNKVGAKVVVKVRIT